MTIKDKNVKPLAVLNLLHAAFARQCAGEIVTRPLPLPATCALIRV
jgi:hypothetical protein